MRDIENTIRARIKDNWYPYGEGFVVDVVVEREFENFNLYQVVNVVSGDRKNYEVCSRKLIGKHLHSYNLDILDETDYVLSIEANKEKLEQSIDVVDGIDLNSTNEYEAKNPLQQVLNLNPNQILDKVFENTQTRLYNSGAQRDGDENKPYTHSIQPYVRLRFGYHMRMGARKYGDKNYLKGFPDESIIESGDRHWTNIMNGDLSEDNCSAMIFAIQLLMLNQEKRGIKPDNWFKKAE